MTCVTISGIGGKELNLQAYDHRDISFLVKALEHALQGVGRAMSMDGEPGAATSDRRYSIMQKSKAERGVSQSSEIRLKFLTTGQKFTYYLKSDEGRITKLPITLFYHPPDRAFYWVPTKEGEFDEDGGEEPEKKLNAYRRLLLSDIAFIFLGKQTDTLRTMAAREAHEDRCISLVARKTDKTRDKYPLFDLDLEAALPSVLSAFLSGLDEILKQSGLKIVGQDDEKLDDGGEDGERVRRPSRRFSIVDKTDRGRAQQFHDDGSVLSPPHGGERRAMTPVPTSGGSTSTGTKKAAFKKRSRNEIVRLITQGSELIRFTPTTLSITTTRIVLFFAPYEGPYGSLFWNSVGTGALEENPQRSLPIHTLKAMTVEIGRAVQQECRDRSRMPSSA
eukprot:TRINITY_DN3897_c0_g1_i8.p1 TRINITY_DN3897_c0_g1~~TRINITY_DN3897_c0_g1_i8.p1  ORF type:complete len:436 (-),score=54.05 TRINITY_DN3897_c0_g1_i8:86-1258(-)